MREARVKKERVAFKVFFLLLLLFFLTILQEACPSRRK